MRVQLGCDGEILAHHGHHVQFDTPCCVGGSAAFRNERACEASEARYLDKLTLFLAL